MPTSSSPLTISSAERRANKVITSETMTTWQKVVRILKIFVGGAAAVGLAGYLFTRLKKGIKNESELKALVNQAIKKKIPEKAVKLTWRRKLLTYTLIIILKQIYLYEYYPEHAMYTAVRKMRDSSDSKWKHRFQSIGNTTPSATWMKRHAGVRWANEHGGTLFKTRVFKPDTPTTSGGSSILNTVKSHVSRLRGDEPIDPKWVHKRI